MKNIKKLFVKTGWILQAFMNACRMQLPLIQLISFIGARYRRNTDRLKFSTIQFSDVSHSLWTQIFHLFLLKEYSPPGFEIKEGDIVVDIGANRGVFTALAAYKKAGLILAYEPDPDNYTSLSNLVSLNGFLMVKLHNIAVAGTEGYRPLYLSNENTRHTIVGRDVVTNQELEESIEVKTILLDDIVKNVNKVDLLKIDCEGAEYEILLSTGVSILEKVRRIVIEYHGDEQDIRVFEIINRLKEIGYCIQLNPNNFGAPFGMIFAALP